MRFGRRLPVVVLIVALGMPASLFAAEKKSAAAAGPPAAKKPGVVAVVNGAEIGLDDFTRELARVQRLVLNTGKPLTCRQIAVLKKEVVEGMVRQELLYQESRKSVRVSDAEIDGQLKKLKEQYASETDFTNALAVLKISPAAFRTQVERSLAVAKLVETRFAAKAEVMDSEIRAYYDRNRDSFRQPEQVRASHILIKVDSHWNEAGKAEARRKIEDIRKKVLEGQDFASLARTYSEDATGPKDGDLGYIRQGQVMKPFEEALFSLKTGEVSGVVETRLGYHLIKAVDRKPEMTIPFESLKDRLRTLLKQEKGREEANASMGKAREKASVQIFLPTDAEEGSQP
jgi:peptidyl-prolyl cis-trans isomerase C